MDPDFAYDEKKGQDSSAIILKDLVLRCDSTAEKFLAITEVDLFIPMMTFVYGQAQLSGKVAIVSLARLKPEFYGLPPDKDLTVRRIRKEVVHELGHTFGLVHCADKSCLMSLSTEIMQVDLKSDNFCRSCWISLEESLKLMGIGNRSSPLSLAIKNKEPGFESEQGDLLMKTQWEILVVDDEEIMRESLAAWLREDGYAVDSAASGRIAVEKSKEKDYAIYFIDLKMPGGMDGIETMMEIKKIGLDASIIIITAYATVDTAISAMKEGAQEYIVKPCNPKEISILVERIIKVKNLQRENMILRKKLTKQYSFHDIISKNQKMQDILQLIQEISSLKSTVLIQGESGTGKELIARAIHYSGRSVIEVFCLCLMRGACRDAA